MNELILIVEDEAPQAEMLCYNLEKEGFRTAIAYTGEDALSRLDLEIPAVIVLDWMLPERSGIDICRQLRSRADTAQIPIIMLTARGEEGDRVLGLDAGADDYVVKPYSPKEIVARVRALIRRSDGRGADDTLAYAGVVMDIATHRVSRDGRAIDLSPTGFKLLQTLLARPGRVFSRDGLLAHVWGSEVFVEPRTVDVHIRRLRKALNAGGEADLIRTVRGAGYAIETDSG